MTLGSITIEDLKMHLKIEHDDEDKYLMDKLEVAKQYIKDYTGQSAQYIEESIALCEIALKIVADLYEQRGSVNESKKTIKANLIYDSMLNMYCINLL